MANKTKKRGGVIGAAVDAAEEIGQAASALKESWRHVEAARKKGRPATRAAAKVGKAAVRTGKKTVKAAARMMPGAKKKR